VTVTSDNNCDNKQVVSVDFLHSVVTDIALFSIVPFKTLIFHSVM